MKKLLVKLSIFVIILSFGIFGILQSVDAGWVSGYYRSNGTWVNGYYRTEPNYYKWDNLSWDGDWSDAYNDKSWYRDFGYDPEPWDDEIPNYDYWDSPQSYDYNYGWDYDWDDDYSYDSYDAYDDDWGYDSYNFYDYDYDSYDWDYDSGYDYGWDYDSGYDSYLDYGYDYGWGW